MFDHESVINSLAVIIVFSSAVTVKVIDAFLQPWTKHNATCILYGIPTRHVLLCSVRTDVFCNLLIFFFIISLLFTFVGLVTNIVMKDYAGGNIVLKFKFDKNQIDICHIEKYRSKFK